MSGFADLLAVGGEALLEENLRFAAGATWNDGWTFYDGAGDPVDFTGGVARCDVRSAPGGTLLATWTQVLTGGRQIVLGDGTINFYAAASTTKTYATTGDYNGVYEIEVTVGGNTVKAVRGKILIKQEITNSDG